MKWKTLIEEWSPQQYFVDTQLKGPYKLWHHTHTFESLNGGVQMTDKIRYEIPAGPIGHLLGGSFVKKDIEKIFMYRQEIISKTFEK